MTDAERSRAWMASVAAHAALGAVVLVALGAGHRHRHVADPAPPTRLVWVEPAPPALGARAGLGAVPAAAPAPAPIDPPPIAAPAQAPKVAPREPPPKPRAKPARLARTGAASAVEVPKPAASIAPYSIDAPAEPPGVAPAAGAPAGAVRGAANGTVGGLGDAAVPLASVAAPPELVDRVVPAYPPRARELEIEGQVLLEVVLDRSGRPERDIKILKSVKLLDAAAVAAVRQWRFRPARDAEGRAVRVVMEVPVRFVLR